MKKKKDDDIQINITISKKKLITGIVMVVLVGGLLYLASYASKGYGSGVSSFKFTNVTVDEYLELMKSEEKKIVYIARPTCSYCQLETPIIKKIANKYNLTIYYLNTENFVDSETNQYTEDGNKFINSSEVYKEGYGTPNTIIVQNGSIVDGVYQYVDNDSLLELFKNNGFINE